ncbi:MAG: prepilin-type N-terminal cleavage/methylation domain-containing protein [Candidatus Omnitrophica bacterium]|nr:prepilin-type N-terminal cleavage/methylation domain-containing protein [Candidatus Omnitrophota bacterium]
MRHNLFKKKIQGFTLVELVMVIVILGICVVSLSLLFSQVMKTYAQPEVMQVATALAGQEMERVTALRYSDIVNESSTAFTGNFSNYTYAVTVSAVPVALATDPGMTDYKQVEVTVSNSIIGSVTLKTVVTNN